MPPFFRPVLVFFALLAGGCALGSGARLELDEARQVNVGDSVFVLLYAEVDEPTVREVIEALEQATPRITRWGSFKAPIRIVIHPTHESLEAAVRRYNYPWLRAWARYDSIDIQSPRTWGLLGARESQVTELLTHELTHCLMYQRAGTPSDWMRKGIPLWFREGMASVSAAQGYRRPTDEEIWRWLRAFPGKDPIADADSLYQNDSGIVYGSAHRAFEFFVSRYGDQAVDEILSRMSRGADFADAFKSTVGIEEPVFSREYVRFVRWEGWRSSSLRPMTLRPSQTSIPERSQGERSERASAHSGMSTDSPPSSISTSEPVSPL